MNKCVKGCLSWHTDRNQKPAESVKLERGGTDLWQAHSPIFHSVITAIGQDCGSDFHSVFRAHRLPLVQRPCGEEEEEGVSRLMNQETSTSTSWIPSWPETSAFSPAQNTRPDRKCSNFVSEVTFCSNRKGSFEAHNITDGIKHNWRHNFESLIYRLPSSTVTDSCCSVSHINRT